jgi:hypothetical protein
MIEIKALKNGAHRNQTYQGVLLKGWAVILDTLETENFPFGDVVVEEIEGVMTVTSWTPIEIPEPTPEPSAQDDIDAMLVDHELRLAMLELGV